MLFVSLVLMNLLIGLAVSDIQGLQNEGESSPQVHADRPADETLFSSRSGHVKRLRKQAAFVVYLEVRAQPNEKTEDADN